MAVDPVIVWDLEHSKHFAVRNRCNRYLRSFSHNEYFDMVEAEISASESEIDEYQGDGMIVWSGDKVFGQQCANDDPHADACYLVRKRTESLRHIVVRARMAGLGRGRKAPNAWLQADGAVGLRGS